MFTKKLTEWTARSDTSESDIEAFFARNQFIFSFFAKNSFNGFLIDYEFLLLKKNFVAKLQRGPARAKAATDMKGMMTSTIFALDASHIRQARASPAPEPRAAPARLAAQHRNPLVFDFVLEYACKWGLTAARRRSRWRT